MIKRGDLVMVVRDCCGAWVGRVFKAGPPSHHEELSCSKCGKVWNPAPPKVYAQDNSMRCAPIAWLRKIDPPSEGETREAYVNLKQPKPKKETV